MGDTVRSRLADSIETALALTGGLVTVDVIGGEAMTFSQNYACPEHGISIEELNPRMFSFNNPFGACETCTGLGTFMKVDPARILPDRRKSIREGAIKASGWYYAEGSISEMYYKALGKRFGFTLDTPIKAEQGGAARNPVRHWRRKDRDGARKHVRLRHLPEQL